MGRILQQELLTNTFSDDLLTEFYNRLRILNEEKQVIHFTFFHDTIHELHKAIIFYYD